MIRHQDPMMMIKMSPLDVATEDLQFAVRDGRRSAS